MAGLGAGGSSGGSVSDPSESNPPPPPIRPPHHSPLHPTHFWMSMTPFQAELFVKGLLANHRFVALMVGYGGEPLPVPCSRRGGGSGEDRHCMR